ncbi:hypothetical protein [Subtercola sp. RTI3]|uniref:hypothetical protein n=1 Tax=Subtercola sp. RTI3 TaxID=3048639 RepID=UPI002B234DB9|nr:hypothetical protein [Subtercola sp. RTI3]MEA9986262.1 hypothetical protein [Subtercola sp. RTI3]
MSRVRDLEIIESLQSIRTDVDNLKSAQHIGGDSLLSHLISSQSQNDYSFPLTNGTNKNFLLTFTPSNSKFAAIVDLFFFYSIGQPDVMTYAVPPWNNGAAVYYQIQKLIPTSSASQWYLTFNNGDTMTTTWTVYLKFIFSSTDSGAWSIAPA